jgi:Tfp pilus assembly major pilin PilA
MYKIDRTDVMPDQRLALVMVMVVAMIGSSLALGIAAYQDYIAKAQARAEFNFISSPNTNVHS